ncbi:MAG: glycosyltransferase family 4 protein [Desulfuromonadales bacterium]|nr:glycosyltransferase family 4 protein [Desulfuromonadales bacterium]MBN2791300.1 glycosyltransferase family 4 protein [Desulfuromonadales bacterium]
MKVIQLLPELNEGGVERGTVELNRELVKRGLESIVISAGGKLAEQINVDGGKHIRFDVCSKNPLSVPLRVVNLRRILNELKPDIIHARSRVPAWLAYLANKKLGIPFVTTVHGFNSVNLYSRVMTYGDRVICVSNAIKEHIQQHYRVPDEKIVVIPRGVDLKLFDPAYVDQKFIESFRQEYQLEGKFVVTSVGRITQLKDYETFIKGIVLVREQIPNIRGLIVGGVRKDKQDYFLFLQKLVRELNAEEVVSFCGSQSKIAEIYSTSDVVVICSKKPESFGRTAAEALAMDRPVVASEHGGVLDIVQAGETGEFFKVGSVSELTLALKVVLRRGYPDSRSYVCDHFSLQNMVALTEKVYCSTITSES